jgi:hypothetical protein
MHLDATPVLRVYKEVFMSTKKRPYHEATLGKISLAAFSRRWPYCGGTQYHVFGAPWCTKLMAYWARFDESVSAVLQGKN